MNKSALLLITGLAAASAQAQDQLTVVTYGGSIAAAQQQSAIAPFAKKTGIQIRTEDYSGGIAQLKAQVEAKSVAWDVVDMEMPDAVRACNAGLLEHIDPARDLAPAVDGSAAAADFLPGTLNACGVGAYVWTTAVAYNSKAFKGQAPTTLADFFDLQKFPGKRGLRKAPQANLEWALMADGVPREQVYATLETEQGLERAFAKLDTIKRQVIWWEAGAQPPQLLADGQVSMTSAWNGRIWSAQVKEKQPFKIIWDGQMYDIDVWAIPLGAPNRQRAMDFLRFATSPQVLADQSRYIAYGPSRKSSQPLVQADMQASLPTAPANFTSALQVDSQWWSDHADELNERFNAWLAR